MYAKLGFDAREPLSAMQGPALKPEIPGCRVRVAAMISTRAIGCV
jgi:hypothetical protein